LEPSQSKKGKKHSEILTSTPFKLVHDEASQKKEKMAEKKRKAVINGERQKQRQ
jgi:hypothetical protein